MTDPWVDAAKRIVREGLVEQQRMRAAALAEQQRQDDKRAAEQASREAMRAAIAAAVPALTRFFKERGRAAQTLLAACGDNAFVLFGYENGGGCYWSVYLNGQGLQHENGEGGDFNRHPTGKRQATPLEAVEAFAYHGAGRDNPNQVCDIVHWLTDSLDRRARI